MFVNNYFFIVLAVVIIYYAYTASQDFIAISELSTFPPGDQHQSCIDIQILDDTLALEGDEHFLLQFSLPLTHNVIIGQPNSSYVIIIDNDGTYELSTSHKSSKYTQNRLLLQISLCSSPKVNMRCLKVKVQLWCAWKKIRTQQWILWQPLLPVKQLALRLQVLT